MNTYVKKLWSLHPSKYKHIELENAIELYALYVIDCTRVDLVEFKTFDEWLRTEI